MVGKSVWWKIKHLILKELGILDIKSKNTELTKTLRSVQGEIKRVDRRCVVLERRNAFLTRENQRLMERIYALESMYFEDKRGINKEERDPKIIVSMTSYPKRISFAGNVLNQMLCQTMKPDKLILWLSKDQFPNLEADLPDDIIDLVELGVEIEWCDGDIKAYKKIIPALKQYPDDLIIIIDDDLVYPLDFVQKLYEAHVMFPNAIISTRAHRIVLDEDGKIVPYASWKKTCDFDTYQLKDDWFFTGGAGTLLPPHVLANEVFDEEIFKEICPLADDIWLNIHAAINQTKICNIAINSQIVTIEKSQEERLWDVNKQENDEQLKNVVEYYQDKLAGTIYAAGVQSLEK